MAVLLKKIVEKDVEITFSTISTAPTTTKKLIYYLIFDKKCL